MQEVRIENAADNSPAPEGAAEPSLSTWGTVTPDELHTPSST
jgi:hypothetical protein